MSDTLSKTLDSIINIISTTLQENYSLAEFNFEETIQKFKLEKDDETNLIKIITTENISTITGYDDEVQKKIKHILHLLKIQKISEKLKIDSIEIPSYSLKELEILGEYEGINGDDIKYLYSSYADLELEKTKIITRFKVNDKICNNSHDENMVLADYLRIILGLTGTKKPCGEGGCGGCVVVMKKEAEKFIAINSCLRLVSMCSGNEFYTSEYFADTKIETNDKGETTQGKNKEKLSIAEIMAYNNAIQCGYCTSGFVCSTAAYCESVDKEDRTIVDIENLLDGNMCRCTGYRPILYACKTLASCSNIVETKDTPPLVIDCGTYENGMIQSANVEFRNNINVNTMESFSNVPKKNVDNFIESLTPGPIDFICGNTSSGIYKRETLSGTRTKIFLHKEFSSGNCIGFFNCNQLENKIVFGAGCTISDFIENIKNLGDNNFVKHISRVASTPIRNIGSIGGNLAMIKNFGFASDLLLALYGLNAELQVWTYSGKWLKKLYTIQEFINIPDTVFFIKEIHIPNKKLPGNCYKIAKRLELSHSIAGACFLVDGDKIKVLCQLPTKVDKEDYFTNNIIPPYHFFSINRMSDEIFIDFNNALVAATTNIQPENLCDPNAIDMVKSLFDKFRLYQQNCEPTDFSDIFQERRKSTVKGKQYFSVSNSIVSQPLVKQEALNQAQGKALFTWMDTNTTNNCLYANFIVSEQALVSFVVDSKEIKKLHPKVEVLTAIEITEFNTKFNTKLTTETGKGDPASDEIKVKLENNEYSLYSSSWMANEYTLYVGQPIALILCHDEQLLQNILVKLRRNHSKFVTYGEPCLLYNGETPLTLPDKKFQISSPSSMSENIPFLATSKDSITKCKNIVEDYNGETLTGIASTGKQFHMYLEQQCAIATKIDDKIEIRCSSQSPLSIQKAVSTILQIPRNKVIVKVRRIGGGFGGKTVQSSYCSIAAACATTILGKQVKIALDINTDLGMIGTRHSFKGEYEAIVDKEEDQHKIKSLKLRYCSDGGYSKDCSFVVANVAAVNSFNCYNFQNFNSKVIPCFTPNASSTAFRAFGVVQAQFLTETVFEDLCNKILQEEFPIESRYSNNDEFAKYLEKRVNYRWKLRKDNFFKTGDKLPYATKELTNCNIDGIWYNNEENEDNEENEENENNENNKDNKDNEDNKFIDFNSTYEDVINKAKEFNSKTTTKKQGVGIMPMMYSISFNLVHLMQGEASISVKGDGSIILLVGCVDMGQGINTKMIQVASQILNVPFSYITVAELNTNTPPNPSSTGASTATDLNGQAVLEAAKSMTTELTKIFKLWYDKKSGNGTIVEDQIYNENKDWFNENIDNYKNYPKNINLFLHLCAGDNKNFKYPNFCINIDAFEEKSLSDICEESGCRDISNDVENMGQNPLIIYGYVCKQLRETVLSDDERNKFKEIKNTCRTIIDKKEKEIKDLWENITDILYKERVTLLYSGHSNVSGVTNIDKETLKGDPDMHQNYGSAISLVEVDMLTGEINIKEAHIYYDAGNSLNPAIDIGQIEGGFIQGCGMMTSEEVIIDENGKNETTSTWEYKPYLPKSIPEKFVVNLFSEKQRKKREFKHEQFERGLFSSKSTGEPPLVLSISLFMAIRDAFQAQIDYLSLDLLSMAEENEKDAKINKIRTLLENFNFTDAPATVSKIFKQSQNINQALGITSLCDHWLNKEKFKQKPKMECSSMEPIEKLKRKMESSLDEPIEKKHKSSLTAQIHDNIKKI